MKKVLVLGYFGYETNQLDGQTVKTRNIYQLAKEQLEEYEIDYFDTQALRRNKILLFQMLRKLIRCKILLYLPAHNNLKIFFPIIFCLGLIFNLKIHYFVVGGWLREFLGNLPLHRILLRHISGIHVETKQLMAELEEYYNYKNIDIFCNFRFFNFQPKSEETDKLRLVFMARVNKKKGLDWIFSLADYIDGHNLRDKYSITFFGPEAKEDKQYFEENVAKYSFIEYKGELQPSEIHKTLSKFDVMLLPTHYYTEGLPGSVVDAYISGIPVIVTEWKHSHEFVEDEKCGYIVPFENGLQKMIEKVLILGENKQLLQQLKSGALTKRMDFAPPILARIYGW